MAAGGFAACLGASPAVIENAAEIGIEHNLGMHETRLALAQSDIFHWQA